MFFQRAIWLFQALLQGVAVQRITASDFPTHANATLITFQHISQCKHNEFYDLDYFRCVTCGSVFEHLQPKIDKFACECKPSFEIEAFYDTSINQPVCLPPQSICALNATETVVEQQCTPATQFNVTECTYKAINYTVSGNHIATRPTQATRSIRITSLNDTDENCLSCNLIYNFHYNGYCIGNALLKPYLKYNSFWQLISGSGEHDQHFGTLKYVAFFCLALHNSSACQQLANLCVISHFSLDKNSPCSAFLLTQATDVAIKYGSMDDHLETIRPLLFYKKGKQTAKILEEPILTLKRKEALHIFHTVYGLDGSLQRWGPFHLAQLDFCHLFAFPSVEQWRAQRQLLFGQYYTPSECHLTLEQLIDLAQLYANNNFISLYMNITPAGQPNSKTQLQALPILVEDLAPENVRPHAADWQLVKRFQMIEARRRSNFVNTHKPPLYEPTSKLLFYRTISYVERFELHYQIHANNRISVPIVKLRYRHLMPSANVSLDTLLSFKLLVSFTHVGEPNQRMALFETLLPILLLLALVLAFLRLYNYRQRRPLVASSAAARPEGCGISACCLEFLLELLSNTANVLLLCFLLYIVYYAATFLLQQSVTLTLPLIKQDHWLLELLIYVAFLFKFLFVCARVRQITHYDIFLVDWERPRSYENNHFNLKNNLETSSVCSSVRTFASESNVSAWRVFFVANEWIRLSVKLQHSALLQGMGVFFVFELFTAYKTIDQDIALQLFVIILASIVIYATQRLFQMILHQLTGDPIQKFIDLCSLANISVFVLLEHSYGFYIHGRSPSGFADTDMYSIIVQLQRDSQNRCSRKGLLGDTDQQSYIILPPTNLRVYYEKLVAPVQRSLSISQAHFQKEINSIDATVERHSATHSSLNRFLCAFIDHAIKDMDYIIKEKTFIEKLCNSEFDSYMTENKGTFYIDKARTFSQLFAGGNDLDIFVVELSLLLALYMLTMNVLGAIAAVCLLNALLHCVFHKWVRQNISQKTSIDPRFIL